jgi:hypothetical protein
MADFNVRSESVDVEQIMKQIRARIREKRGADYTEEQIRELATVRLEKFLDPKNLRSDLLDQFRRSRPAVPSEPLPVEAPYRFDENTLFETHRGALRFIRKLLKPILKLFFNPNPLINVLNTQAQFNVDLLKREQRRKIEFDRSRAEWNALYYEVLHNLVLETTRSGIEIRNLKMRLESLASRLDFSERRVRALEGVVQYRPEAVGPRDRGDMRDRGPRAEGAASESAPVEAVESGTPLQQQPGSEGTRRRRRRRRGRRGAGVSAAAAASAHGEPTGVTADSQDLTAEAALEAENEIESEAEDSDDIQDAEQSWEAETQDRSKASAVANDGDAVNTPEPSTSDLTDDDQQ